MDLKREMKKKISLYFIHISLTFFLFLHKSLSNEYTRHVIKSYKAYRHIASNEDTWAIQDGTPPLNTGLSRSKMEGQRSLSCVIIVGEVGQGTDLHTLGTQNHDKRGMGQLMIALSAEISIEI